MNRRSIVILVATATALGACGRTAADHRPGEAGSASKAGAAASVSPLAYSEIDHAKLFGGFGITISPPPPGDSPAVSAAEIKAKSDSTYNPGSLTTSTVSLGLLTNDRGSDILSWIIHYSRPCHSGTEEGCHTGVDDWQAFNATTGDWLTTWEITA